MAQPLMQEELLAGEQLTNFLHDDRKTEVSV